MAQPRSKLIVLERTPYYHCISRCVRRAYLCGHDRHTGQCFDHRKGWVTSRFKLLTQVFSINIAAYAVMSNHYHLVLHIDKSRCREWSGDEVIHRWLTLHKGPPLAHRYLKGENLSASEADLLTDLIATWRERLSSISWFMAKLNEYIARRANKEDECKGRFWESRFVSRGLQDIQAVLSCMAYIDLNVIRAGLAESPETSDFTSIQQRLRETTGDGSNKAKANRGLTCRPPLMSFSQARKNKKPCIPFSEDNYIRLLRYSSHVVKNRKNKKSKKNLGSIEIALDELKINNEQWLLLSLEVQRQSISMLNGLNKARSLTARHQKVA